MRKHLLSILFLVAAGAIWWASISSTVRNPVVDNNNPVLVTSGYVPYTLAKELAEGNVNVLMLLPPGAEPHAFEPTPGALITLKHANAFVYLSDELEPWAADLAKVAAEKATVLKLADSVPASADPHVWMNLENVKLLAAQIEKVLTQIDPAHELAYGENLAKLDRKIDELAKEFQTVLANCKSREVVHIGHLAFKNLTDAYGLTLTALAGTSHDGEHSAKKLAALVNQIKTKNISAIFTEDTLSPRLAQAVSAETGAQILPLYSIEHISKKDFNQNVTYAELMRRNLESLTRGLQCQAL
ncbi:MAG: zinc ABC transporter substrate-binding protein [Elusimicrobiaceae bacterium]|nr:zinc ABC transporter substrate-binding protein [Elusimicrobiaceae bacterium]